MSIIVLVIVFVLILGVMCADMRRSLINTNKSLLETEKRLARRIYSLERKINGETGKQQDDFHYPSEAEKQEQRAKVKQLQIGDRLRVSDHTGEDTCTVTRVGKDGETFDVSWEEGTGKKTQWYFDIDLFERG